MLCENKQILVKIQPMRIDKFLNVVNITKRRSISEDMCKSGVVSINGVVAKPAKDVKVGDKITIKFLVREVSYEVLAIPTSKSIPKSAQEEYVRQVNA
ncbi:ribosome-associated heat shock protein (S4 domain) [Campylobacter californiensis]|nr:ribosome-associated heat shock protein (S4 domain) [Campylobacter sp. RM6914]